MDLSSLELIYSEFYMWHFAAAFLFGLVAILIAAVAAQTNDGYNISSAAHWVTHKGGSHIRNATEREIWQHQNHKQSWKAKEETNKNIRLFIIFVFVMPAMVFFLPLWLSKGLKIDVSQNPLLNGFWNWSTLVPLLYSLVSHGFWVVLYFRFARDVDEILANNMENSVIIQLFVAAVLLVLSALTVLYGYFPNGILVWGLRVLSLVLIIPPIGLLIFIPVVLINGLFENTLTKPIDWLLERIVPKKSQREKDVELQQTIRKHLKSIKSAKILFPDKQHQELLGRQEKAYIWADLVVFKQLRDDPKSREGRAQIRQIRKVVEKPAELVALWEKYK